MKYRHYAPKAELTIVEGEIKEVIAKINSLAAEKPGRRPEGGDYWNRGDGRMPSGRRCKEHRNQGG